MNIYTFKMIYQFCNHFAFALCKNTVICFNFKIYFENNAFWTGIFKFWEIFYITDCKTNLFYILFWKGFYSNLMKNQQWNWYFENCYSGENVKRNIHIHIYLCICMRISISMYILYLFNRNGNDLPMWE